MWQIVFSIGLCLLAPEVEGARILGVFSAPSFSHQIVYQSVIKELAHRGHELVVLTPNPIRDVNLTNLKQIDLSSSYSQMKNINFLELLQLTPLESLLIQFNLLISIAEAQLKLPIVQQFIKTDPGRFDLIIVEQNSPLMYIFGEIFKCPMVGISSAELFDFNHESFGNPYHPVVYPDRFLPFSDDLTFWERLESFKFSFWLRYHLYFHLGSQIDEKLASIFGREMPNYRLLGENIDMVFVNVNPMLSKPRPTVPAVVEFSSLHIRPKKPLLKDIKLYLDNATQGAIYFSLGSNMRSAMLPSQLKQAILQVFRELPYKVLWKFEEESMPGKPDNVEIRKWLPQQDILGHQNVKLFIMQGGLQSLEESIHNRVPLLGLPFFSDQPQNVKRLTKMGIGVGLDPKKISKEDFKRAIIEIIQNPKYQKNINNLANLMEDQPIKSLDKVVWWMEYVIRHKGAKHLKCPTVDIPWWKYYLLDILAYFIIYTIITAYLTYKILTYLSNTFTEIKNNIVIKLK